MNARITQSALFCLLITVSGRCVAALKQGPAGPTLRRTSLDLLSYDELAVLKDKATQEGKTEVMINQLERMIKVCNDMSLLAEHMIELADLYKAKKEVKKAEKLYHEFSNLFPGHARIQYARFQAIDLAFGCMLPASRDQSKTKAVIDLCEQFLAHDAFQEYRSHVEERLAAARARLLENELDICQCYAVQGKKKVAQKRFDELTLTMLPRSPEKKEAVLLCAQEFELTLPASLAPLAPVFEMPTTLLTENSAAKKESFVERF